MLLSATSLLVFPLLLSTTSSLIDGPNLQVTPETTGTTYTDEGATPSPAVEVTSHSTMVIVRVYVDTNGDGLKSLGEGAEEILVIAVASHKGLKGEAFTFDGEAVIGFQSLPDGTDVQVDIPYLHRSARYEIRGQGSPVMADVRLAPAKYPAYLP